MKMWVILGLISGIVQAGTVEVPWTCEVGRDESGYLPKSTTISVEVDRSDRVKFHPDIFKTGDGFSSFFVNVFSRKSIDRSVNYSSCMNSFADNFRSAAAQYKTQKCSDPLKVDHLCTLAEDQVQGKVRAKLDKSLYLEPVSQPWKPVDPGPQTITYVPPGRVPLLDPQVVPTQLGPTNPNDLPIPVQPRPQNGKFLTFIGGGGEPAGDRTIFDHSLGKISGLVATPDWNSDIIFNGGHSSTQAQMASAFPGKPSADFTPETYSAMIQNYLRKIESGEIKPGDQIMLVVNTHGASSSQATTHTVATSIGSDETGKGAGSVSLDELKKIRDAAEAKGIKLAITDLSCFSGLTQSLATEKTCVISATGSKNYSAGGDSDNIFMNKYLENLKPGRNLEDIYLQTRASTADAGFPEISTSAGKDISSELYPILYRYQLVENQNGGRVFRQLSQDIKNTYYKDLCENEAEDIRKLEVLSDQMSDILKPDMSAVKQAVIDYQKYRQDIYKRLDDLHANQLRGTFKICEKSIVTWSADGCTTFDNLNIVTNSWDWLISSSNSAVYSIAERAKRVAYYQKIKDEQTRLKSLNVDMVAVEQVFSSIVDDMPNVYRLADHVSATARALYDKMYRAKIQTSTTPNPCRDFVL